MHMNNKKSKSPILTDSDKVFRSDPRREIIEYLRSHPEAADTIDGILDWWIPMHRYENAKNEMLQILLELKQQGLIEEFLLSNGSRLYRLHRSKNKQP